MQYLSLQNWGLIEVSGPDAASFLHAQLSQSMQDLPENKARFAAYCTAKGRTLATFLVFRRADSFYLLTHTSLIPALVKRLTMFILRSKCKARDLTALVDVQFCDNLPGSQSMQVAWAQPDPDNTDSATLPSATLHLRMNDGKLPALRIAPKDDHLGQTEAGDPAFEQVLLQLGLGFVTQATSEMFVPQAINWDLIGGIHFEKGCYPGQEIVARTHYLGKSKRRSFLAQLPAGVQPTPGQDVWLKGKTNEPVGNVVAVAPGPQNTLLMLDAPLDDGLNAESRFELKQESTTIAEFAVFNPPYDVQAKGCVVND